MMQLLIWPRWDSLKIFTEGLCQPSEIHPNYLGLRHGIQGKGQYLRDFFLVVFFFAFCESDQCMAESQRIIVVKVLIRTSVVYNNPLAALYLMMIIVT